MSLFVSNLLILVQISLSSTAFSAQSTIVSQKIVSYGNLQIKSELNSAYLHDSVGDYHQFGPLKIFSNQDSEWMVDINLSAVINSQRYIKISFECVSDCPKQAYEYPVGVYISGIVQTKHQTKVSVPFKRYFRISQEQQIDMVNKLKSSFLLSYGQDVISITPNSSLKFNLLFKFYRKIYHVSQFQQPFTISSGRSVGHINTQQDNINVYYGPDHSEIYQISKRLLQQHSHILNGLINNIDSDFISDGHGAIQIDPQFGTELVEQSLDSLKNGQINQNFLQTNPINKCASIYTFANFYEMDLLIDLTINCFKRFYFDDVHGIKVVKKVLKQHRSTKGDQFLALILE